MTKTNKIVIVSIIVGIFCILIGVYANIYDSRKNSINTQDEVISNTNILDEEFNKYTKIKVSEKEVFDRYISEVINMIEQDEYDKIDLILDREEKEVYRTGSYQDIKDEIYSLNIMGNEVEIVNYEKIDNEGLNNMYQYTISNEFNNMVLIVIKEKSPNIYYISFEKSE